MISGVKGMHDYLDLTLYNYVVKAIATHASHYHFKEIATPLVEHAELFKRSLGLETDVVTKEMFLIASTTSDESLCLRPEATASTMRAFLEHSIEQRPWKVFSVGPMFRYERPQKGRFRQFHQANFEIIGSGSIADDVLLIKMLDTLFNRVFKIDSYALVINFLGTQEDRQRFKITLRTYLDGIVDQLCATCKIRKDKNILRVFDCKNEQCQALYIKAPSILDSLSEQSRLERQQLQDQLHLLSISYTVKPTLVRGLDYYDKTVFEFVSSALGAQSAFCGGGRYDGLAQELGSKEAIPAIGTAIGIERLMMILEAQNGQLLLPQPPALQVIIPMDAAQESLALLLADDLQKHGFTVDVLFEGSMKSKMRKANKYGAQHVLILGSDEQAANEVTIKNMVNSTEARVKQIAVTEYLKK